MKLSRFFKTIFMTDFIGGLAIAIKELFKSKKTINYPFEKGKISPRFRGENMHLEDIQMERKDVLPVNCVKLSAQPKLLQSSQQPEMMVVEKLRDMILI